jgi:hypothetical protein
LSLFYFYFIAFALSIFQVLDYYWKGDDLIGYVEVLSTPAGSMLKDLYLTGCRLGMSSRGWATLKEKDGLVFIEEDFELITYVSGCPSDY